MRAGFYHVVREGAVRPLFRILYRVRVEGAERVPAHGPAILAANHVSLLDPFALALATQRPVHFFTKRRLWRYPLLRLVLDPLGGIPVEPGRSAVEAIAVGVEALRRGEVIGVFPQGRVSREGGRWQHGAARLALEAGAPLVPVRLVGTADALRRKHVGLPQVRVIVGEPIPVEAAHPTVRRERELIEQVRAAVDRLA